MSRSIEVSARLTGTVEEFSQGMMTHINKIGRDSYDLGAEGGVDTTVIVRDGVTIGKTINFDNGDDSYKRTHLATATELANELERSMGGSSGSPTLSGLSGPITTGTIRLATKK